MEKSEPPIGCGPITFRVFSLSLPSCACRALCSLGARSLAPDMPTLLRRCYWPFISCLFSAPFCFEAGCRSGKNVPRLHCLWNRTLYP